MELIPVNHLQGMPEHAFASADIGAVLGLQHPGNVCYVLAWLCRSVRLFAKREKRVVHPGNSIIARLREVFGAMVIGVIYFVTSPRTPTQSERTSKGCIRPPSTATAA